MFHSTHIHVPRNQRPSALRTFVTSSSFGPTEGKEPLRRGILFSTVAMVLLLIGGILTWLGFNDVFGGKVSMTGPLLIALAVLLLLLSMRQFMIARKHNIHNRNGVQLGSVAPGTLTTVVVDRDDGVGAVTVIMDSVNVDQTPQSGMYSDDYAPPSYNEVTRWRSLNNAETLVCTMSQDQEGPPPPYEDAVQVHASNLTQNQCSLQSFSDEPCSVPGYHELDVSSNNQVFSIDTTTLDSYSPGDHSSNIVVLPRPAVTTCRNTAAHCHNCSQCLPHSSSTSQPASQTINSNRLALVPSHPWQSTSQPASQTINSNRLALVPSHPWQSSSHFFLIPQMLGMVPSSQKHHRIGEIPPAYQAVDTPGMSPISYSQAMGLSSTDTVCHSSSKDPMSCSQPLEQRRIDHEGISIQPVVSSSSGRCLGGQDSQDKQTDCPVEEGESHSITNQCHIQQCSLTPNPDAPSTSNTPIIDELENV